MTIRRSTPHVVDLPDLLDRLGSWQTPIVQLHPGDVGWLGVHGADRTAASMRVWADAGTPVAIGMFDGAELLRLAVDPTARDDEALALALRDDLDDLFGDGEAIVEARLPGALRRTLSEAGWSSDEEWTSLERPLADAPGEPGEPGVVEVVGAGAAEDYAAVHRSAFGSDRFTAAAWEAMAGGVAYREARSLLLRDEEGDAVAITTVWSAGAGRPGILEPMGVRADRGRRGFGRAVCLAAVRALREMGASSATVAAPTSNVAAIRTYQAAGFVALPPIVDLRRPPTRHIAKR